MKHILIVDDDADCLFQLKLQMSNLGYSVTALESQFLAEEWLEDSEPDLAIIDLMMETEDSGFILSRGLKNKYPDVPVVILTAVTPETGLSFDLQTSDSQQWINADQYIEKGLHQETLFARIEQLLKL
ncbi:MAG: response regulator [Bacteroidetes bacterium]|jgi:DNA-binding response OmpR family regulator|nr:response regulator [Bacteroidota bacterium]MBT4400762.1 response regulator [Bacteroidota bacterium]MBT4408193.1 response regulator [Bacteroidota bacterium]MBT5426923.1 response regulator [Bacteroidota bacterium]MBT7095390.1 response regulator [Bacteroidota bacterium]